MQIKFFRWKLKFVGVQEVAQEIKRKIEDFKPFIPLIQGLRNPGMRSRHWDQVTSSCPVITAFKLYDTKLACTILNVHKM